MSAIVVGVAALIFLLSFIRGQIQSYIDNTIRHEISHIQIHHPDYKEDLDVQYIINDIDSKLAAISAQSQIEALTSRTIANGIISSPKASRGVMIKGIDPTTEQAVTGMNTKIIEGDYLSKDKRNPIVLGSRLADKLQVTIRKKIVLRFQNSDGDIIDAAFRIVGIYKTDKSQYDESNVFIRQQDLNKLLGMQQGAHEVAIYLKNEKELPNVIQAAQTIAPAMLVETYEQLSPDVKLFKEQIGISSAFLMFVVMMALFFGIVNTMLMAVLERYRELGMLMSVGMNKSKVFSMIILETILIGLISAPIGMLIGYVAVVLTRRTGIDLSAYSDGMSQFGLSSVIYPVLDGDMYIQLAAAVLFTSVIGALYPAYKAIKLRPVEAIRKI